MAAITVRPITDASGFHAVETLQRDVWGMPDLEVVPLHQLRAAVSAGGVLLGAFDEHATLVGFCYGFIGLRDGELLFYSHMAGVRPGLQDRGIGFLLKRAQRQEALERGLDRMVWTYDPLQSLNASFNLRKLGVTASRYYVDYYGEMPDAINRGLPSDRLEVDWWLRDPAVETRLTGDAPPRSWPGAPAALAGMMRGGTLAPQTALDHREAVVRVEVPATFGEMKSRVPDLALAWRMASRGVFQHYFALGYQAVDFVTAPGEAAGSYILQRQTGPHPGPHSAGRSVAAGRKGHL